MYKIQSILLNALNQGQLELSYQQEKVAHAITSCKTQAMGGHTAICQECGYESLHYNSCRDRHCPCCQTITKEKWIDKLSSTLVDAPYFHVVFTVPHELNPIFKSNQEIMYNLFYKTTAETLKTLALDPKYKLEANIGFISILHTWGSNLSYHPHLHIILLAGGLNQDKEYVYSNRKFLFPFPVLAKLFKGKFLDYLNNLWTLDQLDYKPFSDLEFSQLKKELYQKKWVPYAKKTFKKAEHVIQYLGRYTHKIAISNSRIISYDYNQVQFDYKDYKSKQKKIMTLSTMEFARRFLSHVLPHRFVRIRYFGIYSNRCKQASLHIIRASTKSKIHPSRLENMTTEEILKELFNIDINRCPKCNCKKLLQVKFRRVQLE